MKLRVLLIATLVAVCTAGAVPAAAQTTAQPTFKSGVDLMRFDVRIVDAAGQPIKDIKAGEVEILEQGRSLPVVLFQRVSEPAGSYVDAALKAVTAEVSSNEAFPRGHLYVLIFDQQHITPGNEQRARIAAEQFIRRRVRPSDRVALFAIPGPGPQIGFTADLTRAIGELSAVRGSYQRVVSTAFGTLSLYEAHRIVQGDEKLISDTLLRLTSEGGADVLGLANPDGRGGRTAGGEDMAVVRRMLQENARTVVNQSDAESRQFLQRLADLVAEFREIEGRKTVVLFSEGFFQDNLSRELDSVAASASQSYAVFYTFDLNQRGPSLTEAFAADTTHATEIQARIAPLATLAVETDGTMVIDAAARSAQALDAIADQAQEYYLVGFTPSEQARLNRGKYQRVTIRVTRPGARVSARTGYALRQEPTPVDRRRAIDSVLRAPFVQQGIKIDYTTYVMKTAEGGGHRVVLSLNADLPVRSREDDRADVVFVARDTRDGRVVASGTDTMALPAVARRGAPTGTAAWRVQFNLPAGSYVMRTVVREPGGLVGSADRRIEVRALDGPDVSVSDLVLGSTLGGLLVRPRAYTGDGLSGVLEAYGRTRVQLEGLDVKVELRRQHDGVTIATQAADLQQPADDAAGSSRRASFLLPLATVAPGEYLAHAVVTARGEIVAERTRQVEVIEGAAPAETHTGLLGDAVAPLEVVRGELGQRYIASLVTRAEGTAARDAARAASEGRWQEVELRLKSLPDTTTMAGYALRGLALFAREDYAGGASALEQALAAEPGNALTAFFLGWAHEGAGNATAALSAWRSAAHLDPSLVSAHLALADGYLRLSQPGLAVQALNAGLLALPSSPELQARLSAILRK